MTRLLLAPAGHGKTQFVIEQIRATLASEPLSPVIVIVPNSIQAAGFRQRLCAAGGVEAAFEVAVKHIGRHVAGIRAGHFEPKAPEEGCPSYCPATNFCWRYKKGF